MAECFLIRNYTAQDRACPRLPPSMVPAAEREWLRNKLASPEPSCLTQLKLRNPQAAIAKLPSM